MPLRWAVRVARWAVAGILSAQAIASCWAAPADALVSEAPVSSGEVRAWLLRIHEAASRRNYQGTFIVSGGGAVSSARIAHFCEGRDQFERSESLDGRARQVLRHNDLVYTVWPPAREVLVEQREAQPSFPALLQTAGDDRIVDYYDVMPQGVDRVAGHDADVLLVKPKDALRYGYRLWADRASGLLLRADVLARPGEVIETSAFSDVAIGVRPQPDSVLQPIRKLDGYRIVRPVLTPTRLESEGWSLAEPAPGFRQVSCVKRPVDSAAAGGRTVPGEHMLQSIFSDGLTYVSVFIEAYRPERHLHEMSASVGATQTMTKRQGNWWVTVVGDVPPATLLYFANGLDRRK